MSDERSRIERMRAIKSDLDILIHDLQESGFGDIAMGLRDAADAIDREIMSEEEE